MQSPDRGIDWVTSAFVVVALIAIGGFGAFVLSERATAVADHEASVARAEASALAAASASAEAVARAERLAARPSPTPYPSAAPGTYRVQKGDSLFSVSAGLDISVESLRHWNLDEFPKLASSPALEPGTLLAIDGPPLRTAGNAVGTSREPESGETAGSPTGNTGDAATGGAAAPQPAPVTAVPPAGSASDWTVAMQARAEAYKAHAIATYDQAVRVANYEIAVAGFTGAGVTPAERAAQVAYQTMLAAYDLMLAIGAHFEWLNINPPAACFADAYAADIEFGTSLWAVAEAIMDSEGHGDLSPAMPAREAFLAALPSYFDDCG